jgi:hypothetical protein
MRSKYFICVFFLLFGVNMLIGQSLDSILKIKKYSSIELLLDDEIDLCVMDDTQINNREDAMIRIRSFLDRYNISDIETLHKGTSNSSGSRYYVFKMNTNSGPIRAFVYYESKNKKEYIKELRFDTF